MHNKYTLFQIQPNINFEFGKPTFEKIDGKRGIKRNYRHAKIQTTTKRHKQTF